MDGYVNNRKGSYVSESGERIVGEGREGEGGEIGKWCATWYERYNDNFHISYHCK